MQTLPLAQFFQPRSPDPADPVAAIGAMNTDTEFAGFVALLASGPAGQGAPGSGSSGFWQIGMGQPGMGQSGIGVPGVVLSGAGPSVAEPSENAPPVAWPRAEPVRFAGNPPAVGQSAAPEVPVPVWSPTPAGSQAPPSRAAVPGVSADPVRPVPSESAGIAPAVPRWPLPEAPDTPSGIAPADIPGTAEAAHGTVGARPGTEPAGSSGRPQADAPDSVAERPAQPLLAVPDRAHMEQPETPAVPPQRSDTHAPASPHGIDGSGRDGRAAAGNGPQVGRASLPGQDLRMTGAGPFDPARAAAPTSMTGGGTGQTGRPAKPSVVDRATIADPADVPAGRRSENAGDRLLPGDAVAAATHGRAPNRPPGDPHPAGPAEPAARAGASPAVAPVRSAAPASRQGEYPGRPLAAVSDTVPSDGTDRRAARAPRPEFATGNARPDVPQIAFETAAPRQASPPPDRPPEVRPLPAGFGHALKGKDASEPNPPARPFAGVLDRAAAKLPGELPSTAMPVMPHRGAAIRVSPAVPAPNAATPNAMDTPGRAAWDGPGPDAYRQPKAPARPAAAPGAAIAPAVNATTARAMDVELRPLPPGHAGADRPPADHPAAPAPVAGATPPAPQAASIRTPGSGPGPQASPEPPRIRASETAAPAAPAAPAGRGDTAAPAATATPAAGVAPAPLAVLTEDAVHLGAVDPIGDIAAPAAGDPPPRDAAAAAQIARIARQVAVQIADIARPLPDRPVEISLRPEELGRLRMTIQTGEGTIAVSLAAERPETADLLRRNIDMLAEEFRALGYTDVSFDFGSGSPRRDGDDAPASPAHAEAAAAPLAEPGPDPVALRVTADGGVDLRL